jgi:hypothetical protein
MRGTFWDQGGLFWYISPETRVQTLQSLVLFPPLHHYWGRDRHQGQPGAVTGSLDRPAPRRRKQRLNRSPGFCPCYS